MTPGPAQLVPVGLDAGSRPCLVVARHGRTAWNAAGRFQGQADPPLDDTGRRQARRLAVRIVPFAPAAVLSSDLRRARSTAGSIATATGAPVVVDPELRELWLGGWEGLDHSEAQAAFPEEYRAWRAGLPVRRGGGETEAEAGRRAAVSIRRAWGNRTGPLVVVSHGVVLRAALEVLASDGCLSLDGAASPHLANGAYAAFGLSDRCASTKADTSRRAR
jgi:broad specificity phosphatase PhoE